MRAATPRQLGLLEAVYNDHVAFMADNSPVWSGQKAKRHQIEPLIKHGWVVLEPRVVYGVEILSASLTDDGKQQLDTVHTAREN